MQLLVSYGQTGPRLQTDSADMSLAGAIDIDFSSEVDIFISIYMIYSGTGGSWFFILNNNQMLDRNDGEIFLSI